VIESSKYVNVDMSKGLAKVTLNNPKMLNCVNIEMVHELMAQLPIINKAKAFWMEGAGAKAFCAGGDIKSLYLARPIGSYSMNSLGMSSPLTIN
jgi:enoyl-CoA hydratase/carnithine racemase